MCLILLAWQAHPDYPLIIAANRDEFYARPAAAAGFWPECPDLLAGRDLEAGGSWLGISRSLRFAALTNFREGGKLCSAAPSRGALVTDFITGQSSPQTYLESLAKNAGQYNGFNLFLSDGERLAYFSNRGSGPLWLTPGIYALSNHLLDTPWPKLSAAKQAFATALTQLPNTAPFFELLADREIAADAQLPETGVPLEWERILSATFVSSPDYGTRASTLLSVRRNGEVSFLEKSFGPGTVFSGQTSTTFQSSLISTGV